MGFEVDEDGGVADDHDEERQPRQADHADHPPHVNLFRVLAARRLDQVLPVVGLQQQSTKSLNNNPS